MVKIEAQVIREGNEIKTDSENLVPGDIIVLTPGNKVPADGRLIESYNLKTNEAALTGEWLPAEKITDPLPEKTPLADRDNMIYMGSTVEAGKGKALETEIGKNTAIGRVAVLVKEAKETKTPLQRKIKRLSKIIGGVIIAVCIFIFLEGILKGKGWLEMFETSVAVAVAAIPEGLPVAMTVILALGMQRILNRKGLVRKLLAAETLGSTSVIATDKTLTLTEGKMEIFETVTSKTKIAGEDKMKWQEIFRKKADKDQVLTMTIAALSNEAFIENPKKSISFWRVQGRPTDKALLMGAALAGLKKPELEKKFSKIKEIPFNTQNKFIATLVEVEPKVSFGQEFVTRKLAIPRSRQILFVSGAPEKIISLCSYYQREGKSKALNKRLVSKLNQDLEDMTSKGLRVVAVAYKKVSSIKYQVLNNKLEDEVNNLTFVGFVGLRDPLREEVKEAIKICKRAGMKLIIVTGDHLLTARAVAKELNLKIKKENIIEGKELDQMSDAEFQKRIKDISTYARVEPSHKMRIIEAWQDRGEVIAMTGDGINDAPALKKADIGVALGSGTDVAKEVSDLVLLTDNFNIIVAAIEEGRVIIDNVRKVITYLLSDSFTEVILVAVSLFLGWPIPIVAVQILWVNLIEDGPLGLCLAFEPKEKDLMQQKPRGHDIPILTREMKSLIFIIGLVTDFLLLGLFFWLIKYSGYEIPHIRSVIFAGLTIDSLFYVFSCKSLKRNIWHINPFSNKFLVFAWISGVIMLLAALYLPLLQILLKTVPISLFDWQLILGLGLLNIILIEATKYYFIVRHQTNI